LGLLLLWLLVVATLQVEGAPDSTHPIVQVPLFDCKEAQDELIPTYPTPLVVLVSGCSMSSAAGALSKRLLKAHGVAIADKTQLGSWEVLKVTTTNPCRHRGYWNNRTQQQVTETAHTSQMLANLVATAASNSTALVTKFSSFHSAEAAAFVRRFTRAGNPPRFVKWTRGNVLDRLVCNIKDCFGKKPNAPWDTREKGGAGKFLLLR